MTDTTCPACHQPTSDGIHREGRWWHQHCWTDELHTRRDGMTDHDRNLTDAIEAALLHSEIQYASPELVQQVYDAVKAQLQRQQNDDPGEPE